MTKINKAACIGGGVIGGAWAARFVLAGIDVKMFDPHPEAERIIGEVMANAEKRLCHADHGAAAKEGHAHLLQEH